MTIRCPRCQTLYQGWSPLTRCSCGWEELDPLGIEQVSRPRLAQAQPQPTYQLSTPPPEAP